jgi:hypothetical protein
LKEVKNILPTNGVKGLTNVKLEEESRGPCLVEPSGEILHIKKTIVDAFLFYEGALSIGDEVIHEGANP